MPSAGAWEKALNHAGPGYYTHGQIAQIVLLLACYSVEPYES
jgi:hypothetical protein